MIQLNHCILWAVLALHGCAQTPPGTSPETASSLNVKYNDVQVSPGIRLPRTVASTIPTFQYVPSTPNLKYSLLLVDLSINASSARNAPLDPTYQLPLAPGVTPDRTTRLHFWQPGIQFASNGTLNNVSEPIAFYQGPNPPPGDIPHVYSFYLFEQGDGFMPPPENNPFNVANVDKAPSSRSSFNVQRLADEDGIGALVAANYITVQNTTGSGGSMTASASSPTGSAAGSMTMPAAATFTGAADSIRPVAIGGALLTLVFSWIHVPG